VCTHIPLYVYKCVIYRLSISNINILIYIYLYIYFQTKCEKYWPDLGSSLRSGALVITSKKETKYAAIVLIRYVQNQEIGKISNFFLNLQENQKCINRIYGQNQLRLHMPEVGGPQF